MRRAIAVGCSHVTLASSSWTLKTIEAEADPFIPALVRATYGENWLTPYVTMFAPGKSPEDLRA